MNKKYLLGFIALALTVVSGASILALRQNGQTPISAVPRAETSDSTRIIQTQLQPTKSQAALKEYSDPAGFRFLYPSDLNLVVEQSQDEEIYSSIKLKTSLTSEYISIKVTQTNFTKLDDWLRANKISPASLSIKRMTFAGVDAYQVPIQNQVITAGFDQGALFTFLITAPNNTSLRTAYDTILSNFSFYAPEGSSVQESAPVQTQSSDVVSDGEEVIE